jgi:hypothetical protein
VPTPTPTPAGTTAAPSATPAPLAKKATRLLTIRDSGDRDFTIKTGAYLNVDAKVTWRSSSGKCDFVLVDRDSSDFLVDRIGRSGTESWEVTSAWSPGFVITLADDGTWLDDEGTPLADLTHETWNYRVITESWCSYTITVTGSYPVP